MTTEHVKQLPKSPKDRHNDYPRRLQICADNFICEIEKKITQFWSNLLMDTIVIEVPPSLAADVRMEVIDRLNAKGWEVLEGNHGQYFVLVPSEDEMRACKPVPEPRLLECDVEEFTDATD